MTPKREWCGSVPVKNIEASEIVVSDAMIDTGLEILEEVDEWPVTRFRLERAFQAMCLQSLKESAHGCSALG